MGQRFASIGDKHHDFIAAQNLFFVAAYRGQDGIRDYWQEKNQVSLDERPTHIFND